MKIGEVSLKPVEEGTPTLLKISPVSLETEVDVPLDRVAIPWRQGIDVDPDYHLGYVGAE